MVKGLIEVVDSEEIREREERDFNWEYFDHEMLDGKKIMRFSTLNDAILFGEGFIQDYLIPKYGCVTEFPMIKTSPRKILRSIEEKSELLGQTLGVLPQDDSQETWLVVPNDRYREVQIYIDSL